MTIAAVLGIFKIFGPILATIVGGLVPIVQDLLSNRKEAVANALAENARGVADHDVSALADAAAAINRV